MQCTSRGTGVVHDRTSPSLTIGVTILERTFLQRSHSVLWEVETGFVGTIDGEVFHRDDGPLTAAVGEDRTNVGEGYVVHRVVSCVTVSGCAAARWTRVVVSATGAEHGIRGVLEVHMTEHVAVVGATCGGTVVREGHTDPLGAVEACDVDRLVFSTFSRHLCACAIKRDTLALSNVNLHTGLDGQVRGDHEVVVGRVDADWAVREVPNWVGRDVSGDISTLAFVRHDAVVN